MENIIIKESIKIENCIHEIRGKQVITDYDLAKFYHVETKRINEAVTRNPKKFPERFSFKLTNEESKNLLVAICDQKNYSVENLNQKTIDTRGGKYKNPRVFTEQGIAMLATILKSSKAVETSIAIMDAFVSMRHYLGNNEFRISNIEKKVIEHDNDIKLLKDTFSGFDEKINKIYFEGQRYDAYSLMIDIFNKSKKEIIIIDNYIDKRLLDILSKTNKNITIITNKYNNNDYEKYKSQYNNVSLKINNNIHDRFIIIDRKILYHCGASFKDLGDKCFAINKIDDNDILNDILKRYS